MSDPMASWEAIDALGAAVDAELAQLGVELTVGGEPTFVAIGGPTEAEWTSAADGQDKRARAERLLSELRRGLAPGAALIHGLGKWYPGETLPRWRRSAHWRADGEPVWTRLDLLAPLDLPGSGRRATTRLAERFIAAVALRLGLDPAYVRPAHEDSLRQIWLRAQLPAELYPADRGEISSALGSVLPLGWDGQRWRTCIWRFRRSALVLLPGELPMGSRLPLEHIIPDAPDLDVPHPADPLDDTPPPLPRRAALTGFGAGGGPGGRPGTGALVRTALCAEARGGRLHVFLPPLTGALPWLGLVAAVEEVAAELDQPVVLEGFEPPIDPRLVTLSVTPDPGVVEVNLHPASSWPALCATTRALHGAAAVAGLTAEKFSPDGSYQGTGGGSHVTLGGPTPARSPFLRRPDLLVSLLTFWQHHPGLSYLFAGRFIGPTSQAPRVDEARHETLGELELAFNLLDHAGPEPPPWLVDRLLRDLLTDVTGNTHRTEFCIDKLFAPDVARGRLGVVELRAFEMPPDPRMGLVRLLFLRALCAWWWRTPYRGALRRWGTGLHDRFLLEHHAWADVADVCAQLAEAGYPFPAAWLRPEVDHRFPVLGRVEDGGVELEVRGALEPWNVLGEDVEAGGTARRVDWSTERIQVRLRTEPGRVCALLCNGFAVPLRTTGTPGVSVAGLRFRARRLERSLHPTLPAQSPLELDVVSGGRVVAACSYAAWEPGDQAWPAPPLTAAEAKARRADRFSVRPAGGEAPDVAAVSGDEDGPWTFDLRAAAASAGPSVTLDLRNRPAPAREVR